MCLNAHCRVQLLDLDNCGGGWLGGMVTLSVVNLVLPAGRISRSVRESDEPTGLDQGEHPGNNLRALRCQVTGLIGVQQSLLFCPKLLYLNLLN